ncbi:hypothetical protein CH72_2366 [Burkholderia ambifaria AMMD]|nr:hypothetical protein CH72_2366 [Burkholderia ambifaria AMMD]
MRPLNHQISFKLGNGIQHLHRHPTRCTGKINTTECEAMDPNTTTRQILNGCAHVHCVPAKAIQLSHDQDITLFHLKQ